MARVNKIVFRGEVQSHDLGIPLLTAPGDMVLVKRGKPRLLIIRCPCSCGDDLIINLDRRAGAAWLYYQNLKGLTLFPSYWRKDGCQSHFILWNNRIYWCRGWITEESNSWHVALEIEDKVYAMLRDHRFIHYEQIAVELELIPWEVLQACRQLVNKGKAISEKWPNHGMYRRKGSL